MVHLIQVDDREITQLRHLRLVGVNNDTDGVVLSFETMDDRKVFLELPPTVVEQTILGLIRAATFQNRLLRSETYHAVGTLH